MSISPYNSLFPSNPLLQDAAPSPAQNFAQLARSLRNGNLSGAQQAFQALQQDPTSSSLLNSNSSNSSVTSDFNTIGQALSNGDLSGAQKAFAQLKSDLQSSAQTAGAAPSGQVHGHHHHHHHGSSGADDSAQTNSTLTDPTLTDPTRTANSGATDSTGSTIIPGSVDFTA